jgi:hypothetical protein
MWYVVTLNVWVQLDNFYKHVANSDALEQRNFASVFFALW